MATGHLAVSCDLMRLQHFYRYWSEAVCCKSLDSLLFLKQPSFRRRDIRIAPAFQIRNSLKYGLLPSKTSLSCNFSLSSVRQNWLLLPLTSPVTIGTHIIPLEFTFLPSPQRFSSPNAELCVPFMENEIQGLKIFCYERSFTNNQGKK